VHLRELEDIAKGIVDVLEAIEADGEPIGGSILRGMRPGLEEEIWGRMSGQEAATWQK